MNNKDWKEEVKKVCAEKGLFSLSDAEKSQLCNEIIESLSKTNTYNKYILEQSAEEFKLLSKIPNRLLFVANYVVIAHSDKRETIIKYGSYNKEIVVTVENVNDLVENITHVAGSKLIFNELELDEINRIYIQRILSRKCFDTTSENKKFDFSEIIDCTNGDKFIISDECVDGIAAPSFISESIYKKILSDTDIEIIEPIGIQINDDIEISPSRKVMMNIHMSEGYVRYEPTDHPKLTSGYDNLDELDKSLPVGDKLTGKYGDKCTIADDIKEEDGMIAYNDHIKNLDLMVVYANSKKHMEGSDLTLKYISKRLLRNPNHRIEIPHVHRYDDEPIYPISIYKMEYSSSKNTFNKFNRYLKHIKKVKNRQKLYNKLKKLGRKL